MLSENTNLSVVSIANLGHISIKMLVEINEVTSPFPYFRSREVENVFKKHYITLSITLFLAKNTLKSSHFTQL